MATKSAYNSITIRAANTGLRLKCADDDFLDSLRSHYSGFLDDGPADFSLEVDVDRDAPEISSPLETSADPDGARLGGSISGRISMSGGEGDVSLPADPIALDGLIRMLFGNLLLRRGGALIHSSCVVSRDAAWVFFGPSESGKSTIVSLCPGACVVADELTALTTDVLTGVHTAHSTPFGGKWRPAAWSPPAALAALFSPVKDRTVRFERIPPAAAAGLLIPNIVLHPGIDPSAPAAALDFSALLAESLPFFKMEFALSTNIMEAVNGLADSGLAAPTRGMA